MAADFFDELGVALSKTAKELSEKAEGLYETQKIRNKILAEEHAAEKIKTELGNMIYKKYRDGEAVDQDMCLLCEDISKHMKKVFRYKEEIAALRGQKLCPKCMKKMNKDAMFCPYCGKEWEEPEAKEEAEVVEGEVVEAMDEVVVGEVVEETEEPEEAEANEEMEESEEAEAGEEVEESEESEVVEETEEPEDDETSEETEESSKENI